MHLGFWRIQSATEGSRVQKEHTNCPDNEQRCGKKNKNVEKEPKRFASIIGKRFCDGKHGCCY